MIDRKKHPKNPLAVTMSYENRLKRYYQDKDALLVENMGIPAKELQEKLESLICWWDV